jgi:hypothetical protein
MLIIFDLDGTVIDSSARRVTREDGSLDLDAWRKSTPENDKLLPLARTMRRLIVMGERVAICTSRVLSAADWDFLTRHKMVPEIVISRDPQDERDDISYKVARLGETFTRAELADAVFYEDHYGIRLAVEKAYRTLTLDPVRINRAL